MNEYGEVLENVSLKEYNSYGVGGKARFVIKVFPDKIIDLLKYLKNNNIPWYVLGSGTNVLLPDNDFSGVIIKLDKLNKMTIKDNVVKAESGLLLSSVIQKLLKESFVNMVNLYGIPGTIGAAVIGNVGSFSSSIFDDLISVKFIDENNQIVELKKEQIKYSYRMSEFKERKVIILEASFHITKGSSKEAEAIWKANMQKRKLTQPLGTKNAGSVFKNPQGYSAGKLIEEAGLKGFKVNDAMVSNKHANFIINNQNAQSRDIINLINLIKEEIKKRNNIDLELEQIIVKWE